MPVSEPDASVDAAILAHFSGKRRWGRVPVVHPVRVKGDGGSFGCLVQDISEGGVLLDVNDPDFYSPPGGEEEDDALNLVRRAFPAGMRIRFGRLDVTLPAEIVRITPREDGRVSLGCQFVTPLSEPESVLLGVLLAREEIAAAEAASTPLVATEHTRAFLMLFDDGEDVVGPRLVVSAMAILNRRSVVARLGPGSMTAHEVAAALAGKTSRTVLMRGGKPLWEGQAHLIACWSSAAEGAVDMRLLLELAEPLGRRVCRHFKAAQIDPQDSAGATVE